MRCFYLTIFLLLSFPGYAAKARLDCLSVIENPPNLPGFRDLNANPALEFTGAGILRVAQVGCYVGNFRHGFPAGGGIMIWLDGSFYRGNFRVGGASGEGEFVHRFGWRFKGQWSTDWPKQGYCTLGEETGACEATKAGPATRTYSTPQRIRVSVLQDRYFRAFSLLRATNALRPGLVFRGEEYDLARTIPRRPLRHYFAGATHRTRIQLKTALQPHRPFFSELRWQAKFDDSEFALPDRIELAISPAGSIVDCDPGLPAAHCDEFKRVDFGMTTDPDNQRIILNQYLQVTEVYL